MTDSVMLALGSIFKKICILVTAAFALTLVPSFRRVERSLLSVRDRGNALLVFLVLGLVEDVAVRQTGWFNHRVIAVCAAGLLAGPSVGAVVGAFVTWVAVTYDGRPAAIEGTSMFCGGVIGGWLHWWRPEVAQRPWTGFCLTLGGAHEPAFLVQRIECVSGACHICAARDSPGGRAMAGDER